MSLWNEFKTFTMRGNVIELAVAVVIGNAFSIIVSSLVDGIIMSCLGLILGGINIDDKIFMLHSIIKSIVWLYKKQRPQAKLNIQEKLLSEIKEILGNIHESQGLFHAPSMAYN